jgi:DNA ligase (NAD+)
MPRNAFLKFAVVGTLALTALANSGHGEVSQPDSVPADRIATLQAEIAQHDELYFKQAAPEITDAEYDRLKRELAALELERPGAVGSGGIGDDRSGLFATGIHGEPMLSLDKVHTEADWRRFYADVARDLDRREVAFVIEPKYDGVAISLTYEGGRLVRAVTRGNGKEGDDVTDNVRAIRGLPHKLNHEDHNGIPILVPERVELRGEIYLRDAEFRRVNAAREQAGEEPFTHPRSAAAGAVRSLDPAEVVARNLSIVIYAWGNWQGIGRPSSQRAFHARLRDWGLPGVDWFQVVASGDEGWSAIRKFEQRKAALGYPVDGVVLKLDDVALREKFGASERAPRWAVAFKYAPPRAVTRIQGITIQVGRTGVLTPVAELEPVDLDGTKVARATLHNRAVIARRDIRVGDFVEVERAGEVIPAVASVRLERRPAQTQPFEFPILCPSCGERVVSKPGGITVRCLNAGCPAQRLRRLDHFASAAAVNISGLGPGTIALLADEGMVATPADLYRLRPEDLEGVVGLGAGRAEQLLAAIERSRGAELWRFIHGLGIPQIGPVHSRRLAETCGDLASLADWDEARFAAVVGGVAGRSAAEFLDRPRNRAELFALVDGGVRPTGPKMPNSRARVHGRVFVFTGTLPGLTRAEAAELVRNGGGIVRDAVTPATDCLVVGTDPGQKTDEALKLGVEIVPAERFLRWLDE